MTEKSRPDCLYSSGVDVPFQLVQMKVPNPTKKKKYPSTIGNRYKSITNSSPSPSRPRLAYCHQIDSFCPTTLSYCDQESIPGRLLLKMDDALFVCRRRQLATLPIDSTEGLLRTLLGAINFICLAGLLFGPGGGRVGQICTTNYWAFAERSMVRDLQSARLRLIESKWWIVLTKRVQLCRGKSARRG